MTVILISLLTIIAVSVGFGFGRNYESERRGPKPPNVLLDLHPSEWERVS